MFYIVESEDQLQYLSNLGKQGGFMHVIPTSYSMHPKLTEALAVYLHPLDHEKGYIIPLAHDEGLNVPKERVYDLLSAYTTLYTLDKKNLLYYFNLQGAIDLQLLSSMNEFKKLDYSLESKLTSWYSNRFRGYLDINKIVPLSKHHEDCEALFKKVLPTLSQPVPKGFDFYNNTATNVFYLLEQEGLGIVYNAFVEMFSPRDPRLNIRDNITFTSYNLYNATSRPTNAFNSVNYAAIPKGDDYRQCFRPKGDYFVEFDFDGYHLRLLCDQIEYKLTDESAHKQLARQYFGTDDITDEQYLEAKQINFHALYGKIPEAHKNLKIFQEIQEYIDTMWKFYEENGVVYNPISDKPFTKELPDMHPAKLMNYMMQSLETARNILILKNVLRFLKDKKTAPVLYTYDAILFDYYKEDGKELLEELEKILSENGKYPVKFKYSKNLVL